MYTNNIDMTDKPKTSEAQLRASAKYYQQDKEAIYEKRREYLKEYKSKKYAAIREDADAMQKRREYAREFMRKKRAAEKITTNPLDDFSTCFDTVP
jgi:hypothetical protein